MPRRQYCCASAEPVRHEKEDEREGPCFRFGNNDVFLEVCAPNRKAPTWRLSKDLGVLAWTRSHEISLNLLWPAWSNVFIAVN